MTRCTITAGAGLVQCCRIAGHTGECHRHFSRFLRSGYGRPHRVGTRQGQSLGCADGAALDGVQP